MKIKFDEQPYQLDAIQSITDLFDGQTIKSSHFTVSTGGFAGLKITELGMGNKFELSEADVLDNVQKIQVRNGLEKSKDIQDWNFTVEMETGTGKTYVYTRTIFELNKKYGFSKFIIVVPSVAILEGVYKSLEITEEHFTTLYPEEHCHYFKYDSTKLEQVRDFAAGTNIEVMIINIDAFRKSFDQPEKKNKANLIHRERDSLNGKKPIEYIQQTHPIVIIDEPQSVDHTEKAKFAIASLHPLCKLRYSATHKETYNLMYKLDPVDAYEQKLVKRIEVLSLNSEAIFHDPYVKLIQVSNKNGYKAIIEMEEQKENGKVRRVKKEVNLNNRKDLYLLSGEREVYRGYVIEGIDCYPGYESLEFKNGRAVRLGETMGGMDDDLLKRYQIRETIRTHLDKELKLRPKGIKVLTLFFIDRVENYRIYPKNMAWEKGKYAIMFEEEYAKLIHLPRYQALFVADTSLSHQNAEEVHNGYFSQDKSGHFKDSQMAKDGSLRTNKDDETAFKLIMKEKERLLSFEIPLRFIFSHSALKEGWDNPNIFQICTLVETRDPLTKRQKIGRGLRLAVNQDGEREYDDNVNILTIIANESYQEFAESLQKEMEEETGVRFGYIEEYAFSKIPLIDRLTGEPRELGYDQSLKIYRYLIKESFINKKGKVEMKLKEAIAGGTFEAPEDMKSIQREIELVIGRVIKKLPVFNRKKGGDIQLNKEALHSEELHGDRSKFKLEYTIELDTERLKKNCIQSIKKLEPFNAKIIKRETTELKLNKAGVNSQGHTMIDFEIPEEKRRLPDILRYLQEHTRLKRRTLVDILVASKRLDEFEKNPQAFMEAVVKIINLEKKRVSHPSLEKANRHFNQISYF